MSAEFLINVQGGGRICVPATLSNITTFVLLEQETWFEGELGFVRAVLEPDDCAVDVGANLGVYTMAMANAVGPRGRLLAFEPTASTAALLRRTLQEGALAQVELVQAALSERRGSALLAIGDSPESNTLTGASAAGGPTERVALLTLDDAAREHGVTGLAFVKIDAEGHELPVLRGAVERLRADAPLVMFEVSHGDRVDVGVFDFFASLGFGTYRLVPGLGIVAPFRPGEALDPFQLNLFACTPERARALAGRELLAETIGSAPTVARDTDVDEYLAGLPGWHGSLPPGAYGEALLHFASAQAGTGGAAAQLAHVVAAQDLAARALAEATSIERALTCARLSADLGLRKRAVNALASVAGRVEQDHELTLREPCVAPAYRFATLDAAAEPTHWLQAAVIEGYVRLAAFSCTYTGVDLLGPLEFLKPRTYYCAEMERRRQLVRIRAGMQECPEPHPLLIQDAADNLNAWFWSGRPGSR